MRSAEENSKPLVTYLLLTINIATYLYLAWQSQSFLEIDLEWMFKFGFVKERFLDGAYWQLVTNMFTHFDFPHLGYNMLFLAFFGSKAENIFGGSRTLLFYIVFGSVTTMVAFLYPLGTISAGASGAIFGLLGSDLIAQRGIYKSGIWSSIIYGVVFFVFAAATGVLAHLVGLGIGFIVGYIVTWDWYPAEDNLASDD
jgi:rhomboid protease GluP